MNKLFYFFRNFFQSIYGFKVSEQSTYSLFSLTIAKNNRLNGGDFGFEVSYLALRANVKLIFCVLCYYEKKKNK
jgi:hypothetical protein